MAVLKKYATFSGRARRKEYWMFQLFNMIIIAVLYTLAIATGETIGSLFMVIYSLYALGVLLPSLAVTIRRLHDIGKSGSWFFISFVPFIGGIWLLILTCTEGNSGENSYGSDPKESSF